MVTVYHRRVADARQTTVYYLQTTNYKLQTKNPCATRAWRSRVRWKIAVRKEALGMEMSRAMLAIIAMVVFVPFMHFAGMSAKLGLRVEAVFVYYGLGVADLKSDRGGYIWAKSS